MKKVKLILFIILILILVRMGLENVIYPIWEKAVNIGSLGYGRIMEKSNIGAMVHFFILLPFLVIRILTIKLKDDNLLFKKEMIFNFGYIILFNLFEITYALSYLNKFGFIIYVLLFYLMIFKFKMIKKYLYSIIV